MPHLLPVKPFQQTVNQSMCGPATLKMVFEYYGIKKSEAEIAKLCGTTSDLGTDEQGIKKAAESVGFSVTIKDHSNFEDIQNWLNKKVPVIVDWFTGGAIDESYQSMPDGHYSVVVGLDSKYIFLQDPEIGRVRKISRYNFARVWFDFPGNEIN